MTSPRLTPRRELRPGLIFDIAHDAGIDFKMRGSEKAILCCPFHDDSSPSAVLFATNVFHCSGCGLRLSARKFIQRLRALLGGLSPRPDRSVALHVAPRPGPPPFSDLAAASLWQAALDRALDPGAHEADTQVFEFLRLRKLEGALSQEAFGVLPPPPLPTAVESWRSSGHRLLAPLFDLEGHLVGVQSRSVTGSKPKTRAPAGGRLKATVFANHRGLALLRGEASAGRCVVYGEGLTDHLAYTITCPFAALCAPGASNYASGIGDWAKGAVVILAADADPAGEAAALAGREQAQRFGAARVVRLRWKSPAKDACDVLDARGEEGLRAVLHRFTVEGGRDGS